MSYLNGLADNHGKSAVPKWNFHKILINKEGKIEETYYLLLSHYQIK